MSPHRRRIPIATITNLFALFVCLFCFVSCLMLVNVPRFVSSVLFGLFSFCFQCCNCVTVPPPRLYQPCLFNVFLLALLCLFSFRFQGCKVGWSPLWTGWERKSRQLGHLGRIARLACCRGGPDGSENRVKSVIWGGLRG